ncbi:MAG: hypothetical protein M1833_006836 [Piccolia ochrophora]|nr:MAG: hypothetical protein M1833_006836 [Piccolia ochrophora]
MDPQPSTLQEALANLLGNYNSLNPSTITILTKAPTPLEFHHFVSLNRPFVVRGGAADYPAVRKWNLDYLLEAMGQREIDVAVTPHGNADAVITCPDGLPRLVQPLETRQSFASFMHDLTTQSLTGKPSGPVKYAQSQNNNLPTSFSPLSPSLPLSIPFAHAGLLSPISPPSLSSDSQTHPLPDAVNIWLGSHLSTTALHRDPYENIFVQIRGRKTFVLVSSVATAWVGERWVGRGRWVRDESPKISPDVEGEGHGARGWRVVEEGGEVPVPRWDPEKDQEGEEKEGVLRVTVEEGDILYLPALWYHHVSQESGAEGFCCSVNYWYDMEFGGPFHSLCQFVRDVAGLAERGSNNGSEAREGRGD